MKKNLLYLVLVIGLGAGAWFTYNRNQRRSTIDKLDLNFAVPDTASISKIKISGTYNKPVTLERQAGGPWKFNEKYEVAPVLMGLLLTTIHNVEMMRPLVGPEAKTVLRDIKERYRKVEIFVRGELYKTYWVGDDAPENIGTYMKLEGGDPYVCHLRGHNGFLTPRFNVTESGWRHKLLFSSTPQSLQSIEVKHTYKPAADFKIQFQGKRFGIDGANRIDTQATVAYMLRFKKIYLERFYETTDQHFQDSILKTKPEWTLELVDIDKAKSHLLHFYTTKNEDRTMVWMPRIQEFITIQNQNVSLMKMERQQLVR